MKLNKLVILLSSLFILSGCNVDGPDEDVYHYDKSTLTGEISSFDLISPFNSYSNRELGKFTWEKANNASYYNLEIASTETFISNDQDEVYLCKTNLESNEFDLTTTLPKKNILYYWRVTAYNKDHFKVSNSVFKFYFEANNQSEIKFDLSDPEEFQLHEIGSYAKIGSDDTNFFGNNETSLTISFEEEDTNRGVPESDGWLVITKTEEKELYGTDALFLNFYYSGNDASFLIRLVDNDGEYWHCPIQIANNAKQTVLLKFSDFELRTRDTTVQNRVFNYEHIKYLEFVFERTFGDGVCLISGLKAVCFENYKYMFLDKLDFNELSEDQFVKDTYNFKREISNDGTTIKFSYNTEPGYNGNEKGINTYGYGFTKVVLNKYFSGGDAIRMKVKYDGYKNSGMNFVFRILEEDNDRWQYKQPMSSISYDDKTKTEDDEIYTQLVIPLKAMLKTDYILGDGAKQFYFIQNLQFGANYLYGTGSFTIKDFEVITVSDYYDTNPKLLETDGVIEDFDDYENYAQMYLKWDVGTMNKDEAMILDSLNKVAGNGNKNCCELDYKSDMGMATYSLFIDTTNSKNHNALSLWLKDASFKSDSPKLSYLDEVNARATIQLSLVSGEFYRYTIDKVLKDWNEYVISFNDFECVNEEEFIDEIKPLSEEYIVNFAIGLDYFYYESNGKAYPVYTASNPVFIDEIKFCNESETTVRELNSELKPDPTNPNICYIEDAENYSSDIDVFDRWSYGNDKDFNNISLSHDVSSNGGNNSLKLQYQYYDSVSYVLSTSFKSTVKSNSICFDVKGDDKATLYFNITLKSGAKFRYQTNNVSRSWKHYEIGFTMFNIVEGSGSLISTSVPTITKISIGLVKSSDANLSYVYLDNIYMDNSLDSLIENITTI